MLSTGRSLARSPYDSDSVRYIWTVSRRQMPLHTTQTRRCVSARRSILSGRQRPKVTILGAGRCPWGVEYRRVTLVRQAATGRAGEGIRRSCQLDRPGGGIATTDNHCSKHAFRWEVVVAAVVAKGARTETESAGQRGGSRRVPFSRPAPPRPRWVTTMTHPARGQLRDIHLSGGARRGAAGRLGAPLPGKHLPACNLCRTNENPPGERDERFVEVGQCSAPTQIYVNLISID